MSQTSVRRFEVGPGQYTMFRFSVRSWKPIFIRLIATAPVDILLLDSDDRTDYENGNPNHSYRNAWGRRVDLQEEVQVEPGTWYVAIEGRDQWSTGRLEVYH